jgi:lipocalin
MEPWIFVKVWWVALTICNPQTQECDSVTSPKVADETSCNWQIIREETFYKADGWSILGKPECKSTWIAARTPEHVCVISDEEKETKDLSFVEMQDLCEFRSER